VGNGSTKRVALLLDGATTFDVTAIGDIDVFPIADGSTLDCTTVSAGSNMNANGGIHVTSSAVIRSVISPADRSGHQSVLNTRGCSIVGFPGSSVSGAYVDLQGVCLGTFVEDTTIHNPFNAIGFRILPATGSDGASRITSDIYVSNLQSNGGNVIGARPCVILSAPLSVVASISFVGGGCQHAGVGQYELDIDGQGVSAGVHSVFFYGYHTETSPGSLGVRVKDAVNMSFNGLEASGAGTRNQFTVLGASTAIELRRAYGTGTATNWIENDSAGGMTIPFIGGVQADYYFGVAPTFNSATILRQN
jgi:hypothetical protein